MIASFVLSAALIGSISDLISGTSATESIRIVATTLEAKALPSEIFSVPLFPASMAPEIRSTIDAAKLAETVKIPKPARQISTITSAIKV